MTVAVTGGSGKIGQEVIRQLLARGHRAINIDTRQAEEPLVRFVYADTGRREQVQPVLEQVDAVCHLGEIPGPDAARGTPLELVFANNTRAAAVVLQTAADLKLKRMIYTSSCQAYGMWHYPAVAPQRLPFDETHPLCPQNPYALSKYANERYARFVAERFGLSVAIFRFPWVVAHWTERQTHVRMTRPEIPLEGMGTYLHVSDAARAYVLALENPRPGCEAYHFSAADVLTGIPLRDRLAKEFPDYPALPNDWPDYASPMLTDKAREHFGWEAKWSAREESRGKSE